MPSQALPPTSALSTLLATLTQNVQSSPSPPPIKAIIHTPLPQPLITSIYDPSQTYSRLAQKLVETIYEQSNLLTLLTSIHPQKLTAYQLLFGEKRSIIIKPSWKKKKEVVKGCLDINVLVRVRNEDLFTPDVSILHSLHNNGEIEVDLVFYRIRKNDVLGPYVREDAFTKLMLVFEDENGRGYARSEVRDWDVENDHSCDLSEEWICSFEPREDEMDLARLVPSVGGGGGKARAKNSGATKQIAARGTKAGTQVKAIKPGGKKQTAAAKAIEEDAAMADAEETAEKVGESSKPSEPVFDPKEAAKALAAANPKPKINAKAMADALAASAAAKQAKGKGKSTAVAKNGDDEENTSENEAPADKQAKGKGKSTTSAAKNNNAGENTAEDEAPTKQRKRSKSISESQDTVFEPPAKINEEASPKEDKRGRPRSDSHASLALMEEAKALAKANPKPPADPETVAKILASPSKNAAVKKSPSKAKTDKSKDEENNDEEAADTSAKKTDASSKKKKSKVEKADKDQSSKKNDKKSKSARKAEKAAAAALAAAAASQIGDDETDKEASAKKDDKKTKSSKKKAKLVSDVEKAPPSPKKPSAGDDLPMEPAEGLTEGWMQKRVPRPNGKGVDTYFFSPKLKIRCRSKPEAKKMIVKMEETAGDETAAWAMLKEEEKIEREAKKKRKLQETDENDGAAEETAEKEAAASSKKKKPKNKKKDKQLADQ
ncbi:hypothetical protein ACHAWO_011904 [Cyclotella atomus]|uniref:Uncharacterized protein n=1 Tax=Cyclotella atomus TaxID=382360 RepID=A0ABD3NI90_9STRA